MKRLEEMLFVRTHAHSVRKRAFCYGGFLSVVARPTCPSRAPYKTGTGAVDLWLNMA